MEQYDVSVRLAGREASLIPQMVPFERPALPWSADGGELKLVCEMEQNPPGLIAWTTARNHRWSTHTHWRSGVFLRHEDGHEALVDFTSRLKRRLTLTVRGEYPAHFMHLLQDGLETLIRERWPYLDYGLYAPCPTVEDGRPCTGVFPLTTLYRARAKGLPMLRCQTCLEEVSVGRLLEGYVTPTEPLSQQLVAMEARLIGGASGSKHRTSADHGPVGRDDPARAAGHVGRGAQWATALPAFTRRFRPTLGLAQSCARRATVNSLL
jgi:hypothetical protein